MPSEDEKRTLDEDTLVAVPQEYRITEFDQPRRLSSSGRFLQQSTSQISPARGSGTFKITFKFIGITPGNDVISSFNYAAQRLGKMITSKLAVLNPSTQIRCEDAPNEVLPSPLEDVFIFVNIGTIDGTGGTLGRAGPCLSYNGFTRVGYVQFDSADVAQMISQQRFDAVCVHEISHVLGFGTYWDQRSLLRGTADPRYNGAGGVAGLSSIGAGFMGTPPVEATGGEGTARSHWRDTTFDDEMMTGYLGAAYQPMSAMTVQAFADLGFTVDTSVSDTYTAPSSSANTPYVAVGADSGPGTSTPAPAIAFFTSVGGVIVLVLIIMTALITLAAIIKRSRPTTMQGTIIRSGPTPMSSNPNAIPMATAVPMQMRASQGGVILNGPRPISQGVILNGSANGVNSVNSVRVAYSGGSVPSAVTEASMKALRDMGFTDDAKNQRALATAGGDVTQAVELLFAAQGS